MFGAVVGCFVGVIVSVQEMKSDIGHGCLWTFLNVFVISWKLIEFTLD